MKQIVHLACIAFVISSFFCASCVKPTPCHVPKNDTSFINSARKAIVPYKVGDIINFKHQSGQTWSYKLNSIDSGYDYARYNEECYDNYYLQHVNYNLWKQDTNLTRWDIKLSLYYNFGYSNITPLISVIYMNNPYITLIDAFPPPPSPTYQFDTIIINNFKYFFVNKLPIYEFNNNYNVFYNQQYGILKMITATDTLERIP